MNTVLKFSNFYFEKNCYSYTLYPKYFFFEVWDSPKINNLVIASHRLAHVYSGLRYETTWAIIALMIEART